MIDDDEQKECEKLAKKVFELNMDACTNFGKESAMTEDAFVKVVIPMIRVARAASKLVDEFKSNT